MSYLQCSNRNPIYSNLINFYETRYEPRPIRAYQEWPVKNLPLLARSKTTKTLYYRNLSTYIVRRKIGKAFRDIDILCNLHFDIFNPTLPLSSILYNERWVIYLVVSRFLFLNPPSLPLLRSLRSHNMRMLPLAIEDVKEVLQIFIIFTAQLRFFQFIVILLSFRNAFGL